MQGDLIVDCDLFAGINVTQRIELNVPVMGLHIGVGFAAVVDVMRAVSAAAAVKTEAAINVANP